MSNIKERFPRIFTDIEIAINDGQKALRQVNISASGIAFVLDAELEHLAVEDIEFVIDFDFKNVSYTRVKAKVVRYSYSNGKLMIGAKFIDFTEKMKSNINRSIISLGGYDNKDLDKKLIYLSWYAPDIAEEIEKMLQQKKIDQQ